MLLIAEFIGVCLVGYGIWYTYKGIVRLVGTEKDWWRPLSRRQRYPYPAAGILLGLCFIVLGLRFALGNVWANARMLSWVGLGGFALVLLIGIGQPRFLHPRWYGRLQDSLGKQRVAFLQREAQKEDTAEWAEIAASKVAFEQWVARTAPSNVPGQRRGRAYSKDTDRESNK